MQSAPGEEHKNVTVDTATQFTHKDSFLHTLSFEGIELLVIRSVMNFFPNFVYIVSE